MEAVACDAALQLLRAGVSEEGASLPSRRLAAGLSVCRGGMAAPETAGGCRMAAGECWEKEATADASGGLGLWCCTAAAVCWIV